MFIAVHKYGQWWQIMEIHQDGAFVLVDNLSEHEAKTWANTYNILDNLG